MSTCTQCEKKYDNKKRIPKVLPCGDTFCEICLKQRAMLNPNNFCPKCETPCTLTAKTIENLRVNNGLLLTNQYEGHNTLPVAQKPKKVHKEKEETVNPQKLLKQ